MKFYFTFGCNHLDRHGRSMGKRYVTFDAATYEDARDKMFANFGNKWSHQYESPEEAGIGRFKLTELTKGEYPPTSERMAVLKLDVKTWCDDVWHSQLVEAPNCRSVGFSHEEAVENLRQNMLLRFGGRS